MMSTVCFTRLGLRGKRPFAPIFLSLILMLLLAACGGQAEPAAEPAAEPDAAAPLAPAEPAAPAPTAAPTPTATPRPEPTETAREHFEQGQALAADGAYDAAAVALRAALSLEPDNADALAILGGVLLSQEKVDEALAPLHEALRLDAAHPLALANLCTGLALNGAADAEPTCRQALAAAPDDADVHNSLGILFGRQQAFDSAIAAFEEAIRLEPDHRWAHNNLGRTYVNMGRYADGIAALNTALRITPENAQTHYNLGLAYAQLGQYEAAIPAYEAALRYDPGMVLTHIDLAVVYTRMEQYEAAIGSFEAYLTAVPEADNRAAVEAEIARLAALAAGAPAGASVDHADPAAVLQAVFDAAASGDYAALPELCDPLGENDGDTAMICAITADHANAADFVSYFGKGRIAGEVTIDGETAELPFLFGPDGDQMETMQLILRDGKWYLFGF